MVQPARLASHDGAGSSLRTAHPTPIEIIWVLALLGLSSIIARRRRSVSPDSRAGNLANPTCFGTLRPPDRPKINHHRHGISHCNIASLSVSNVKIRP